MKNKKYKILIVEDDKGILDLMENIIAVTFHQIKDICVVTDGNKALSSAISQDYDIIISDINLKGSNDGSGLVFIRDLLKARGEYYYNKILAVSADYDGLIEAGGLGVETLRKPFEISEFQQKIRSIIMPEIAFVGSPVLYKLYPEDGEKL